MGSRFDVLQGPVMCVLCLERQTDSEIAVPLVLTGSADASIKVWDPMVVRQPGTTKPAPCIQVRGCSIPRTLSGGWLVDLRDSPVSPCPGCWVDARTESMLHLSVPLSTRAAHCRALSHVAGETLTRELPYRRI